MNTCTYDVLVVGAGPAGSSAARAAAGRGVRVLVVERKAKIGAPVRCAEYIPAPLLGQVERGREAVVQSVRGMRTILPGGEEKETAAPGFMIHRDQFDRALAEAARRAGAEIRLSTRVLSRENGKVMIGERGGYVSTVSASVIIGADGPHSTVGRWIGCVNRNLMPALQVRVALPASMDHTEIYFHREIYGGYGWLFPKGQEANVGLGMKRREDRPPPLRQALDQFLIRLAEHGKIRGKPYAMTAGWLPAEPIGSVVKGNVLLAGDAAGQTHPITGAGILPAVVCGRMAGEIAAEAAGSGDLDLLKTYDLQWRDLFWDTLERAFRRRQLLEREWDRLDQVIKQCWVAFREYYAESQ